VREEQTEAEAVEAALERELDSSSAARLAFGADDVEVSLPPPLLPPLT